MPKSKRAKLLHLTKVTKKTRDHKEKLFTTIREAVPEFQYIFVLAADNMRNTHLQDMRQELSDSRLFLTKTTLMRRALGSQPSEAAADGTHLLARYLTGPCGLLLTNRSPEATLSYLASLTGADFARPGATAPRAVVVPPGIVYSTGGDVDAVDDVPLAGSLDPELRRLGMPTRLIDGRVVLGGGAENGFKRRAGALDSLDLDSAAAEGYTVCKEGDVLDARQARLLRLFSLCLAEFRVVVKAYWSAASGEITEVEGVKTAEGEENGAEGEDDDDGGVEVMDEE